MGWELRHGRRYLYHNRRVNGKPVKEYVAADDRIGFGALMAAELDERRHQQIEERQRARQQQIEYRTQINALLADATATNRDLRAASDGLLVVIGYRKHNRGEWRMRRDLTTMRATVEALEKRLAELKPLVNYEPPAGDAEAIELFAKARAGDGTARDRLLTLIRNRQWVNWLGDLGQLATRKLVRKASGGDVTWEVGITQKANALHDELLGPNPGVLERLLARRVVNGWLVTHALELELTLRPPVDAHDRAHLDKALTRAQKRYTEAIRELARIRRLQAPTILAQLNVATAQTVVNGVGAK